MANGVYKIIVEVTGAPSGSEQLPKQPGTQTSPQPQSVKEKKQVSQQSRQKVQDTIDAEQLAVLKKATGAGVAIGAAGLQMYEQNLSFKGDTNQVTRIGEIKKWGGKAVIAGTLLVTNPAAAALYIGYTAFNLAQENRQIIHVRENDSYSAAYYQERLINDVSKRSR